MNISIITAMTKSGVIGLGNNLPWNIPEELNYFKKITLNKVIIMGSKTFISINKKPLPKRYNIVLTKNPDQFNVNNFDNYNRQDLTSKNLALAVTIQDSLLIAADFYYNDDTNKQQEIMVIGGSEIYKQFLPIANKLYISIIKKDYPGDVFFPEYDKSLWHKTSSEEYEDCLQMEFVPEVWERL